MPDFAFEDTLAAPVAGIDEVGRGPWAGPVTAAAAVIDRTLAPPEILAEIDDSKALSRSRREAVFALLTSAPGFSWGIGEATVAEIDSLNILRATFLAMRRAAAALPLAPAAFLVDGNRLPPGLPAPALAVVKGDARSLSIAAASIIAKVTRDRLMERLARECPGYGWERNAGYGTAEHRAGLERFGLANYHRRSFSPIRNLLTRKNS